MRTRDRLDYQEIKRREREEAIRKAQEAVERERTMVWQPSYMDETGSLVPAGWRPREGKEKLEPAAEQGFLTIEWERGFVTVPICEWKKLPEAKKNKLMAMTGR